MAAMWQAIYHRLAKDPAAPADSGGRPAPVVQLPHPAVGQQFVQVHLDAAALDKADPQRVVLGRVAARAIADEATVVSLARPVAV